MNDIAPDPNFQPKIIGLLCYWCAYVAADSAGVGRMVQSSSLRIVRLNCSGMADPAYVMKAFASGADGVLIAGCHPGDCHYTSGNLKAQRRFFLLRKLLEQLGIAPERVRLEWIAASEPSKLVRVVEEMTEQIRQLGPLQQPERSVVHE